MIPKCNNFSSYRVDPNYLSSFIFITALFRFTIRVKEEVDSYKQQKFQGVPKARQVSDPTSDDEIDKVSENT